jgi:hypothetical protein
MDPVLINSCEPSVVVSERPHNFCGQNPMSYVERGVCVLNLEAAHDAWAFPFWNYTLLPCKHEEKTQPPEKRSSFLIGSKGPKY